MFENIWKTYDFCYLQMTVSREKRMFYTMTKIMSTILNFRAYKKQYAGEKIIAIYRCKFSFTREYHSGIYYNFFKNRNMYDKKID